MSLSVEELAAIRRKVQEFKAAQRERNPKTVAEELPGAMTMIERLTARFGVEAWRAIGAALDEWETAQPSSEVPAMASQTEAMTKAKSPCADA